MSWHDQGTNRDVWYVGPVYRQMKDTVWRDLKRFARPYAIGKPNESDLSIEFVWGNRIALRSASNYDSLRGPGLNGLVIDEYADIAKEAWTEVMRPMLSDREGSALFIGTPKGRNHFYDLAQEAKTSEGWSFHSYTTLDGCRVTAEEIEAARRDLDERTFRQEYEASFENWAGAVYYAFQREANVVPNKRFPNPIQYDPRLPISWSLDFNVNPMCSVIGQLQEDVSPAYFDPLILQNREGKRVKFLWVLDEMFLPNSNTAAACQEFHNRIKPYLDRDPNLIVKIYGDASGSARQTAGGPGAKSDWEIVRREMQRLRIKASFHYKSSNPGVKDRVAAVNSLIKSTSGELRLFVRPHCKHLIKDLEQVAWKPGTALIEKEKDPELTHISDALGYWVEAEAPLRSAGGFMGERVI